MKKFLVVFGLFISIGLWGQDRYSVGMDKAFLLWKNDKPREAANLFERIATVELENWLPYYYVAHINTLLSFGEKDENKLSLQLEKAEEYLNIAKMISPNNAEILIQQALINTAWIAFDGASYGPALATKNTALYDKVLALEPLNPRGVLSKAEWDMGTARYFGKDTSPYCLEIKRSLELFTNFKPKGDYHPNWGKHRAEYVLEGCNLQINHKQ